MNPFIEHPNFIFRQSNNEQLNDKFRLRYPILPADYEDFLHSFSFLSNTSDTTWFNSIADFNETDAESAFKWNEFELKSLEAFEGDSINQNIVLNFWNKHLPIILSVKNDYAFFAMGVSEENFGEIYYGEAPEYEEVNKVANNFSDFLEAINNASVTSFF